MMDEYTAGWHGSTANCGCQRAADLDYALDGLLHEQDGDEHAKQLA